MEKSALKGRQRESERLTPHTSLGLRKLPPSSAKPEILESDFRAVLPPSLPPQQSQGRAGVSCAPGDKKPKWPDKPLHLGNIALESSSDMSQLEL